ncbi:MAG TPA: hypothetical protein VD971_12040 [Phycisphaerales bacterium]|nr:hypothetical protein [Phycisphaerales bacterium]
MHRVAIALTLLITACASPPPPAGGCPEDFSLAVLSRSDVSGPGGVVVPAGWWMMDADGALRVRSGEVRPRDPTPGVARTLSRSQIEQLWAAARDAGLAERTPDGEPAGTVLAAASQDGLVGVSISAGGRRRTVLIDPADTPFAGAAACAAMMREWAWR